MNPKLIAIAALPLLFAACAQQPVKQAEAQKAPPAAVQAAKPAAPKLPDVALSDDLLFEFLIAEISGQRGDLGLATQSYVDMARKTHDPRIVQRALDVALFSGNLNDALEMAKLLTELDPASVKARQALSALLAHSGNLEEARASIAQLLSQQSGEGLEKGLLQLDNLFARQTDRKAVLDAVQDLTRPYLEHPEAHYAIAVAAWRAGEQDLALLEADRAESLRPGWEAGALLKMHILEQVDKKQVQPFLQEFLGKYPKSQEVRMDYAKFLVSEKQYPEARAEFLQLKKIFPENQDVALAVGLLSLQLGDIDQAVSGFKELLDEGYKSPDLLRYYLGQAYELKKNPREAEKWYRSVERGNQFLPAQIRVAYLLMQSGNPAKAKRFLHGIPAANAQQKIFLVEAEAQMLHDSRRYEEAYAALSRGLAEFPDSTNLLYDQAMAAENIGKIKEAEASLKKLIRLQPDFAQAYNALGYTLVEHTTRFKEALPLLEKALSLAPEDPFILDSMGWLQYKMGNLPSAVDYLRRAYAGRRDPEIAAHLAEALWAQGNRDEAKQLLQSALKENPGNEALLKSMKKLLP